MTLHDITMEGKPGTSNIKNSNVKIKENGDFDVSVRIQPVTQSQS